MQLTVETGCVQDKHPLPREQEKLTVLSGLSLTDAVGHQQCHRAFAAATPCSFMCSLHLLGCWPLLRWGFTLLAVSFFHFLMHIPVRPDHFLTAAPPHNLCCCPHFFVRDQISETSEKCGNWEKNWTIGGSSILSQKNPVLVFLFLTFVLSSPWLCQYSLGVIF